MNGQVPAQGAFTFSNSAPDCGLGFEIQIRTERPVTVDFRTVTYSGSGQRTDWNTRPYFVLLRASLMGVLRKELEPASLFFCHRTLMFLL